MKNKIVTIIILVLMGLVIFTPAANAQIFYFNSRNNSSPSIESNNYNNTQENVLYQKNNDTQRLNNIFYFFTKNYANKTPQLPTQPVQPEQSVPPMQPVQAEQPVQPEKPIQAEQPQQPIISGTNNIVNAEELKMLDYINQERAKAGVAPLQMDTEIAKVAQIKSQDMVEHNYFSHTSPTYGSPFEMMKNFGITYRTAGENIARNSTMLKAHIALMNSEGHRNNILNPNYTHIGVGIVKNQTSAGITVTQMFIGK